MQSLVDCMCVCGDGGRGGGGGGLTSFKGEHSRERNLTGSVEFSSRTSSARLL
jgi:hypothetical protein